jgi:predicted membrane channel-forming protein YqfA (hemolysin III family)
VKPRLRGFFHEIGFYASTALGLVLVVTAEPGGRPGWPARSSRAASLTASVRAPATTGRRGARGRAPGSRLDHAGIYLSIAGSHAPFGMIVMSKEMKFSFAVLGDLLAGMGPTGPVARRQVDVGDEERVVAKELLIRD